jgi:two-component system, LytTR family, sensor kinase
MMNEKIPYRKIFRLALITTPLFGLFGATPAFVIGKMDISRIPLGFILVTGLTFTFWAINISLLRIQQGFTPLKNNWIRYLLSTILATLIFIIVSKLMFLQGKPHVGFPPNMPAGFIPRRVMLFPLIQAESINIITIVLLEMVLLRDEKQKIQTENNLLRISNLEAKHNHLKQQLHPHFLFNSLSTLRSLIKRSPGQAEEYLEKLSEILRSSINSNTQTLIPLSEEIELSINYLHMQQVRFGKALNYHINIPSSIQVNGKVPVYSIQLLVENAIKHNVLTITNPLNVFITGNEENKTICVSNNLQPKSLMEKSNGIGLPNLSERYKLLGSEDIIISKSESEFKVIIKVIKDESSNN